MRIRDILHRRVKCHSCGGAGSFVPAKSTETRRCDSCGGVGHLLLGLNPMEARAVLARLLDRVEALEIKAGIRPTVDDVDGVA